MTFRRTLNVALAALMLATLILALAAGLSRAQGGDAGAAAVPTRPVSYYRAERVAQSFEKGAVLYAEDANYMIHTSRRVAPGMAEVHARDTDLIYVLQGSATFVTGGRVVDPRTTAPDEIRGASIAEGETRELGKGDVIIVPAGTPHWFKDVRGPVLYYTIKVR